MTCMTCNAVGDPTYGALEVVYQCSTSALDPMRYDLDESGELELEEFLRMV